jgi:hypothetical protein
MNAWRSVFDHRQYHAAFIGVKAIANDGRYPAQHPPGVLHGHAFTKIWVIEGPKINNL